MLYHKDSWVFHTCHTWSGVECDHKDRHNLVLLLPFHHPVSQRHFPRRWIREMLLLVGAQPFICARRDAGGRGRSAAAVYGGERPARSGTPWTAAPPKPRRRAFWWSTAVRRARQSLLGVICRRCCTSGLLRARNLLPVQQGGSVRPLHHPVGGPASSVSPQIVNDVSADRHQVHPMIITTQCNIRIMYLNQFRTVGFCIRCVFTSSFNIFLDWGDTFDAVERGQLLRLMRAAFKTVRQLLSYCFNQEKLLLVCERGSVLASWMQPAPQRRTPI